MSMGQENVGNVAKKAILVNSSGSFARMHVLNVAYMNVMVRIVITLAGIEHNHTLNAASTSNTANV